MIHIQMWAWAALLLLGAWHGINPAMGWLFAVALGLQRRTGRAVWQALVPIVVGHLLSIATVVTLAVLVGSTLSPRHAKYGVALLLLGFSLYRIFAGKHHPSLGGMQVGFGHLVLWSFLMASAHGAGLMLLPVLLGMGMEGGMGHAMGSGMTHFLAMPAFPSLETALVGVGIHTFAYVLVMGTIAWVVYRKLGLFLLRKAWFNLDMVWGVALMATAGLTLLIP
ncbi:MAG: hypothetical protein WAM66_00975 [Acidobacteriaceae bacterium]